MDRQSYGYLDFIQQESAQTGCSSERNGQVNSTSSGYTDLHVPPYAGHTCLAVYRQSTGKFGLRNHPYFTVYKSLRGYEILNLSFNVELNKLTLIRTGTKFITTQPRWIRKVMRANLHTKPSFRLYPTSFNLEHPIPTMAFVTAPFCSSSTIFKMRLKRCQSPKTPLLLPFFSDFTPSPRQALTPQNTGSQRLRHIRLPNWKQPPSMMEADPAVLGGVTEALEFLAATTLVIPLFRRLNLSPILGFLLAGVILGPHGLRLIRDVDDVRQLADFGVLFLLFEMGLELSLDRLRKLRKYAFGMGSLQILFTAAVLGLGAYGMGGNVAESAVIGSALSLSSSAFILQILTEKGERQSRAGVASFGVLLMQDIAIVPLLLLVPLLKNPVLGGDALSAPAVVPPLIHTVREGAKHVISALGILNVVILAGGALLKRFFTIVADSRSSEAFTSAVLLTVLGTAMITERIGLSMTMGAFVGGVLLAESSFRSRIKIDLEPFRGLFLGLFFTTTGMSLDLTLFVRQPLQICFLISSLMFCKTVVTTLVGLPFGLSLAEALRVGLLLGQGGEFAFVLFALGSKLGLVPDSVNSFLCTTVVASMAFTPFLYQLGCTLAPIVDRFVVSSGGIPTQKAAIQDAVTNEAGFVAILGYGPVGKVVGRMLSRKFIRWIAVDIDRETVTKAVENNLPVVYGDCTHPAEILETNELSLPDAFVITYSKDALVECVLEAIRSHYPDRPVYVRARNQSQQKRLLKLGAWAMYPETLETSLQLGQSVLQGFQTSTVDISAIKSEIRSDFELNEVFSEHEVWFKKNMRTPGRVNLAAPVGTTVRSYGTMVEDKPKNHEDHTIANEKNDAVNQDKGPMTVNEGGKLTSDGNGNNCVDSSPAETFDVKNS